MTPALSDDFKMRIFSLYPDGHLTYLEICDTAMLQSAPQGLYLSKVMSSLRATTMACAYGQSPPHSVNRLEGPWKSKTVIMSLLEGVEANSKPSPLPRWDSALTSIHMRSWVHELHLLIQYGLTQEYIQKARESTLESTCLDTKPPDVSIARSRHTGK